MSNLGKPAYQGRPDPESVASRFMLIFVILLLLGFVQAAIKNGWLAGIVRFILS